MGASCGASRPALDHPQTDDCRAFNQVLKPGGAVVPRIEDAEAEAQPPRDTQPVHG